MWPRNGSNVPTKHVARRARRGLVRAYRTALFNTAMSAVVPDERFRLVLLSSNVLPNAIAAGALLALAVDPHFRIDLRG